MSSRRIVFILSFQQVFINRNLKIVHIHLFTIYSPCFAWLQIFHYSDVVMGAMASLITSLTSVYSTVHPGADQSKHQSPASLAFVRGIHRRPVNSPHKWPVTRKMFPFDDVIMLWVDVTSVVWLRHLYGFLLPYSFHFHYIYELHSTSLSDLSCSSRKHVVVSAEL